MKSYYLVLPMPQEIVSFRSIKTQICNLRYNHTFDYIDDINKVSFYSILLDFLQHIYRFVFANLTLKPTITPN